MCFNKMHIQRVCVTDLAVLCLFFKVCMSNRPLRRIFQKALGKNTLVLGKCAFDNCLQFDVETTL